MKLIHLQNEENEKDLLEIRISKEIEKKHKNQLNAGNTYIHSYIYWHNINKQHDDYDFIV